MCALTYSQGEDFSLWDDGSCPANHQARAGPLFVLPDCLTGWSSDSWGPPPTPLVHIPYTVVVWTILSVSFWPALGNFLLSLWCSALFIDSHCEGHGSLWALTKNPVKASGFRKQCHAKCFCWIFALTTDVRLPMLIKFSVILTCLLQLCSTLGDGKWIYVTAMTGKCSYFLLQFKWVTACILDLKFVNQRLYAVL